MTQQGSLIRRLGLTSLLTLSAAMAFSAFTLNSAYIDSLESAEQEALQAQLYALLGVADPVNDTLVLPPALSNPRFETPESGLYARLIRDDNNVIWRSNSLATTEKRFAVRAFPAPGETRSRYEQNNGESFRQIRMATIWETPMGDRIFCVEVMLVQTSKQQEIKKYQQALWLWLGGMAVLLVLLQMGIAYWGLKPLRSLAGEIGLIEQGEKSHLKAHYPLELTAVTLSINKLLRSESTQRERYKNSLADLAHSLKTPLSVIRSQLEGTNNDEKSRIVDEQVEHMAGIIGHQLKRASAHVQAVYGPNTQIAPIVKRLSFALKKVYAQKLSNIDIDIPEHLSTAMEKGDLMEILGNLMENACKYGRGWVKVSAKNEQDLVLCIEDNGPGVPSALSNEILQRGARADTSKIGQGIGLSIAVDILSSYKGALHIQTSSQGGGAAFLVTLPKEQHAG